MQQEDLQPSHQSMTQTPCLGTGKLTIRRFRPADADDLYEYLSDPLTFRFERGEPVDREQASQRAADMAASPDFWAVELRGAGKVIGQLYLKQIEPAEHLTCELGYILNPTYQRQGCRTSFSGATPPASRSGSTLMCTRCWLRRSRRTCHRTSQNCSLPSASRVLDRRLDSQ